MINQNKLERFYLTSFFSQPRQYNVGPSCLSKSSQLILPQHQCQLKSFQILTAGVNVKNFSLPMMLSQNKLECFYLTSFFSQPKKYIKGGHHALKKLARDKCCSLFCRSINDN
jgi:hypothetical protein